MVEAQISLPMEILTMASIKTVNLMGKVSTSGLVAVFTKENFQKG